MDIAVWIERWGEPAVLAWGGLIRPKASSSPWCGEPAVLAWGGLILGLDFGFFGQRSKFGLRAAVIEF